MVYDPKCKFVKIENFDLFFGLLYIIENKGLCSQIKKKTFDLLWQQRTAFSMYISIFSLKTIISTSGVFLSHRDKATLIIKKLQSCVNSYDLIFRLFDFNCFLFYFVYVYLLCECEIVFWQHGRSFTRHFISLCLLAVVGTE